MLLLLSGCIWIDTARRAEIMDHDGDEEPVWSDCDDDVADVGAPGPLYVDGDGDGLGAGETFEGCPGEGVGDAGDCDDTDPTILGASEWYLDADGDGHGAPGSLELGCAAPSPDHVRGSADDCDDTDRDVYPGAPEQCETGRDADCDGEADHCDIVGLVIHGVCSGGESAPDCTDGVGRTDASGIAQTPPGVADLDADGRLDLVVPVPWVRGLFAFTGLTFEGERWLDDATWGLYTSLNNPATVTVGNFIADDPPDLVIADPTSPTAVVALLADADEREPLDFAVNFLDDNVQGYLGATVTTMELDGADALVVGSGWDDDGCGAVYVLPGPLPEADSYVQTLVRKGLATRLSVGCSSDTDAPDGLGSAVEPLALPGPALVLGFRGEERDAGGVWIYDGGLEGAIDLQGGASAHWSGEPDDLAGAALTSGDFDADGAVDLAVGSPYGGARLGMVFVFLDVASHLGDGEDGLLADRADAWLRGEMAANYTSSAFGFAVEALDADGDGTDELAVGAPDMDGAEPGDDRGVVYLFADVGRDNLEVADARAMRYGLPGSDLGYSLAAADLDRDGAEDLLVGAPYWEGTGAFVIVSGASGW